MQPFRIVEGVAAALPGANIDTDVIMPKMFLKGIDRSGLDRGVFHDLRFAEDGRPRPDFVLNRDPWRQAAFLVVGPNFGCGSSREHAVWGLKQLGVRALLGVSFAGIFFDNCARNGLLALTLPEAVVSELLAAASDPARCRLQIDLPAQTLTGADGAVGFDIDPVLKTMLVDGLDPVGATLRHADEIRAFEAGHFQARPWLRAAPDGLAMQDFNGMMRAEY
ncbi:3-isopropylmalate dehydratase small subunit [Caulobacter sp. KR2-114]|uniref:3-isopropylmalate dehydratase small subunit n=1 Tax=Caulobacter sp. KR2-114 TaxID=3400912 RepID=UPI003BFDDA06